MLSIKTKVVACCPIQQNKGKYILVLEKHGQQVGYIISEENAKEFLNMNGETITHISPENSPCTKKEN